ncbi:MAG TPA: YoaK family protein [Terrimicrobium sp.]
MSATKGSHAPAFAATEAFFLSGVGGCIDSIGVLTLGGLFVSHMSGNSAALGAAFGHGDWRTGLPHLFAVPLFLVGLFAGYLWILRAPTYRRCASILLIEAVLLALFAWLFARDGSPERNTLAYFGFAALPLLAMGLQNATLREVGRSAFPSTYITGVLDALAKSAALAVIGREESGTDSRTAARAARLWLCYLLGALSGSAGLLLFRAGVLLLPVSILVVMAARFLSMPDRKAG